MDRISLAKLLLRLGLAFVFSYAATGSLLNPELYVKFVPSFVGQFIPINLFLLCYGIFEIILALWILSGKLVAYSGIIAVALLFMLTTFNYAEINVLFRNVAIITGALALVILSIEPKTAPKPVPVVAPSNPALTPVTQPITPPATSQV